MGQATLEEQASIATPAATRWALAPRADGYFYYKGNDGIERQVAISSGGVSTVPEGGTGRATGTTAYALIATGTTPTGAQQTLGVGATTDILVGAGAAALPVWTAATGSGSPVRGTTPTIATPVINGLSTGTGVATANTVSTLVARDSSGNFAAGTITAALTGVASGNLVSGGALGTPSSGTATNLTGTAAGLTAGNASTLGGATFAAPGPIGSGTPGTGAFTSGTFSTTLGVTGVATFGAATGAYNININGGTGSGNGSYVTFKRNGVDKGYVGSDAALSSNNTDDMLFGSSADVHIYPGLVKRVTFASGGIVTMNAYGAGAATFSSAGVISSVSDERLKIKDGVITDPISMLMALEPGYYFGKPEANMGPDRQLGFYAQNVRKAIGPEAAPDPEEGRPWGYFDRSVLAVAIESLKKQQEQIQKLISEIASLRAPYIVLGGASDVSYTGSDAPFK